MEKVIRSAAWLICAVRRIYERKWHFLGVFALVFIGGIVVMGRLDLLPSVAPDSANAQSVTSQSVATSTNSSVVTIPELPVKITIRAINLSATISNPTTTDDAILDQGLLKGAVRYPTSAKLGETGNVVLFGHSSYLPIVGNQAYKTFDGIQKLKAGDVIIISSSNVDYTYKVKSVTKESANDATIPLSVAGRELTLSTCDSFAEKTDRFVVVADFVESHPALP